MGRKVLLVRLSVPDLRIEILPLPMLRGFLAREVVGEAEEKEGVRPRTGRAEQSIGGLAGHFSFSRALFLCESCLRLNETMECLLATQYCVPLLNC